MSYLFNKRVRVLVLIVGSFLAVSYAQAADKTFTGNGYWSNADLWGGTIPAPGDVIWIDGVCIFDATTNLAYSTLTVGRNNAGTLTWPSGGTGILNVTDISSMMDGSSINMTYGGTINLTGNWTTSHMEFTGGTGTVIYSGAAQTGAVYTYNNLTLSNSGIKTFANPPTINGVLSMEGIATVTVTDGAIIYGAAATLQYNTATSRTASSEEWIPTFSGTGGVIIDNTGTITMNAAKVFGLNSTLSININSSLSTNNFQLDFGGNFVNNGTFIAGSSPIVITNTGEQLIYKFTTTGLVSMTKTAGTATLRGNVSGGGLTINGPGGTLNLGVHRAHNFSGIWTRTAGTLDGGSATISFTATGTVVSGSGGMFTPNTGTVGYTRSGAQTVASLTYNNLSLGGSGLKTTSSGITVNGTLFMEGTATASDLPTYGSSAVLQYSGSSTQTTGPEFPAIGTTGQLSTVKIENPSGVILNENKNIGPRSFIIGSFANNSIFKDGGLTLTSTGTLNLNSGSYIVTSGSLPAFTAGTTIAEGTTMEYASASSQVISGITYSNLTISGSGNNSKIAGGDITVNGILNLSSLNFSSTQGCLDMNTPPFTLTMGASATTTGTGDVTGIVTRNSFAVNTPYSFGNQFTTINMQAGGILPSSISVEIVLTTSDLSWKSDAIHRYYDIAQTGGDAGTIASLNLHYLSSELNGANEGNLDLFDYHVSETPTQKLEDHDHSNSSVSDKWIGLANQPITYLAPLTVFPGKYWTLGTSTATNFTWIGASTDWELGSNWADGVVPGPGNAVIIPDAITTTNSPTLPESTIVGSINIQTNGILNGGEGTTLTIDGGAGAWDNLGIFNAGTSTVVFTSAQATLADSTNFYSVTVADGSTLTLGTNNIMRIAGVLSLSATGILNATSTENTVEYNGTDQIVIDPNGSTAGYHELILSGSGMKTLPAMTIYEDFITDGSASVTAGGDLSIVGNVALGYGSTFDPGKYSLTVSGDWTNNGATFNGGSSNIIFNNRLAAQSINGTASEQTFHDITINKFGETLIIDGSTTSLTLNNLTLTSGTLDAGAGTMITVEGLWKNSGDFIPRDGIVGFNGNSEQSINGFTTFNDLRINNTSGGVILESGGITVNGVLDLESANISDTQGALHTGEFTLGMGPLSTTIGAGDVTGYVERTEFNIGTTYTFGNQFTTVSILEGSETLPANLKFKISIGTAPAWKADAINREYEIVSTGAINCNANVTQHYIDNELNGNAESHLSKFLWQAVPSSMTDLGRSAYNTTDNWIENDNVPIGLLPTTFGTTKISMANSSYPTFTWNGSQSSSWNEPSNWTTNSIPTETSNIIIPHVSPYDPEIPEGGVSVKSLEIQARGYLRSNSHPVTITGSSGALIIEDTGAFDTGTGTVTFTGTGATIAGTTNFYNLTISSGADLSNLSGSRVTIAGTMTNNGIWHTVTGSEPSVVEYNGDNQNVVIPNPLTNRYSTLILSGTGVKTLPEQQLNITGDLSINGSASATANQDLAVTGNIMFRSGTTFNASSFNINAGGNWSNSGTFNACTGTVTFNGTSAQIISGTTTFNNMTIKNPSGVILGDGVIDIIRDLQSDNRNLITESSANLNIGPIYALPVTCKNLTIESGASLTISPTYSLTITGTIVNNEGPPGFVIQSSESGNGQLVYDGTSINGKVELWSDETEDHDYSHFIVPPVQQMVIGSSIESARAALGNEYFYGDLLSYSESLPGAISNKDLGWAYFDGYPFTDYSFFQNAPFATINSMQGYNIHYHGTSTFSGSLNTVWHSFTLSKKGFGWNLVGNPYPCNYDVKGIDNLVNASGVESAIYVNQGGIYVTYNVNTGVGASWPWPASTSSVVIPSMQGFFVHASEDGAQLTLPVDHKSNTQVLSLAKSAGTTEADTIRIIKLALSGSTEKDETAVCLIGKATTDFDGAFDAYKLFGKNSTAPTIYTVLGSVKYAINSLSGPVMDPVRIPVTVELKSQGTYNIDVTQFENLKGISVRLKHGTIETDLSKIKSYSFTSAAGTFSDFELIIGGTVTVIKKPLSSGDVLKAWYRDNFLYINCPADVNNGISTVTIYDMQGKPVYKNTQLYLTPGQTTQLPLNIPAGVYFTQVVFNNKQFVSKIVVF